MKSAQRIITGVVFALAVATFVGLSTSTTYADSTFKLTICHATGNPGHYTSNTVSGNSAAGVPTSEEIFEVLAQSGHFGSAGEPAHFRPSWGGQDFWVSGAGVDCDKVAPPPGK
jgi:hypothetical protein